jgi:dynein heavy chain
MYSAEK